MPRVAPLVGLLLLGLAGCANSSPEVRQVFSQINDYWDPVTSQWQERLSVFVLPRNADGLEELAEFRLIHDGARLSWTMTPETWSQVERSGEVWVGANNLQMPEEAVPTGAWRAEVVTRSGLVASAPFAVPPPLMTGRSAPRAPVTFTAPTARSGDFLLTGFPADLVIWAYSADGKPLAQKTTVDSRFTLASLASGFNPDTIRRLMFYSYDRNRGRGVAAGPFELK